MCIYVQYRVHAAMASIMLSWYGRGRRLRFLFSCWGQELFVIASVLVTLFPYARVHACSRRALKRIPQFPKLRTNLSNDDAVVR